MPPSPTVICRKCKKLTNNPNKYCDNCQDFVKTKKDYHKATDSRRGTPSERGYDWTWKKTRDRYLHTQPLCEDCIQKGDVTVAQEVHHIVPIAEGGSRLDFENLKALCKSCHSKITSEYRKG